MEMYYRSTRGGGDQVTASQAILKGLAEDGGLYVPVEIPKMEGKLEDYIGLSYQETAYRILKIFLTDYTEEELRHCINSAYDEKFDTEKIAPLVAKDDAYYLELFRGKTIAFKDMALSILPHLLTTAAKKNEMNDEIVILTATSGDTGKAALAGFADVPGTRIFVFYPKHGVSAIQEKQMVTQVGDNTCVVGTSGNFDDAQTGVKRLFSDPKLADDMAREGFRFSSANSINIGRLLPQVVYYVYAYAQLCESGALQCGEPMNVCVPTGNFGNILAAWYAAQIGVPMTKLICASNENKVLYDFFETGVYDRNRDFVLTTSPSMDILISSNLERLVYLSAGCDAQATAQRMKELAETGKYSITAEMKAFMSNFVGGFANEAQTAEEIAAVYEKTGYVIDTHTAVASRVYHDYKKRTGDATPTVIASTASPYKFSRAVLEALGKDTKGRDDFELVDELENISGVKIPRAVEEIRSAPILHKDVIDPADMDAYVRVRLTQ